MSDVQDPELLEIPGAGDPIAFLRNLFSQAAPLQGTPGAMQMPLQGTPGAMQIPLQQIAGLGANEQKVQGLLSKYLGTSATGGEAYRLGMGELKKTLGGEFYDPRTSDFWKGFREESEMEQEKGIATIRRRGQLGGGLFATPGGRIEAEDVRRRGAQRGMVLGGLYEKERERKLGATQQALSYAGFGEQGVLSRLQAGTTIGAIPRQIEGARYQAAYNQRFGQAQESKATAQQQAQNLYTQQLGQSQADYAQQQQQTQNLYQQEMFPYTAQADIARQLMPQWLPQEGELDFGKIRNYITQFLGLMGDQQNK